MEIRHGRGHSVSVPFSCEILHPTLEKNRCHYRNGSCWTSNSNMASAGTVDTALNLIGLGEYVKPYEDFVDGIIHSVWDFIMNLNMMLQ